MRLIVTADLHFNHRVSRPLAGEVIDRINQAGGDVLLVVGDTSIPDGDTLEQCLSLFHFNGPKLIVAGNHELWTHATDSYALFSEELPRRVKAMGWTWLETDPFVAGDVAIVGSLGWYDYSFAQPDLGIPKRFYESKVSPGAAQRLEEFAGLFARSDDIAPQAMEIVARWNDGRFVKLHRSDEAFLDEICTRLRSQLRALSSVRRVIAGIHHLPFVDLLPPPRKHQWDFAKAFLGSGKLGDCLLGAPNVTHVFCGHSHFPAQATIGRVNAINVGSGYRWKTFQTLDLEP